MHDPGCCDFRLFKNGGSIHDWRRIGIKRVSLVQNPILGVRKPIGKGLSCRGPSKLGEAWAELLLRGQKGEFVRLTIFVRTKCISVRTRHTHSTLHLQTQPACESPGSVTREETSAKRAMGTARWRSMPGLGLRASGGASKVAAHADQSRRSESAVTLHTCSTV